MRQNDIIFYMRFVRTGSSTITEHLKKHLKGYASDEIPRPKNDTQLRAGHLVHYGIHNQYPGRLYKYITIMRDPAEWLVSVYNQDESRKHTGRSFKEWCEDASPNSVCPQNSRYNKMTSFACWLFNAKDIKECYEVLDKCWFVGLTENLGMEFHYLCEYLGINDNWQNYRVSGEYDKIEGIKLDKLCILSDDLREWIYETNPIDVDLYNYAKICNLKTRKNILA